MDFENARTTMVDCQIRPNDVTDHRVLDAFMSIPREAFVSPAQRPLAYIDEDLPLSSGGSKRYLMEAMSMSKLVQLANIEEDNIILDIGCGTGYSTAVLSKLGNSVVALESDEALAGQATETLIELGCDNTVVVTGALEEGLSKEGPYDVIFFGGAVEVLPDVLLEQLKDGGRLVVVEGTGNAGVAKLYTREGDVMSSTEAFNCSVMMLPGFEREMGFTF